MDKQQSSTCVTGSNDSIDFIRKILKGNDRIVTKCVIANISKM